MARESLQAQRFGQTAAVSIATKEKLKLELVPLPFQTSCSTTMIQTHWSAWCLTEPQTVNPKEENQLIQIKVKQMGLVLPKALWPGWVGTF